MLMSPEPYDLIVVGAGPAGSEAARTGARLGMRTLLLERRALPRPKLCGGCVSLRAQRLLGEPIPARLVEASVTRVRLRTQKSVRTYKASSSYGALVDRGPFDQWLAGRAVAAGAALRTQTARRLDLSGPRPRLYTDQGTYRADAVILATGADGPLTGAIRAHDPPEHSAIGLERILSVDLLPSTDLTPGTAEFDFSSVRSGFSWGLHHGDRIYLGIGGLRTDKKSVLEGWRRHKERWGLACDAQMPRGHLIPCGGHRRRLGRGRALLAGDAAGFVDAFTGEGIALALHSGRLAAESLASSAAGAHGSAKLYAASCEAAFGRDLKWALKIKRLTMRAPVFLDALCNDSGLFESYLAVFAGESDYSKFVSHAGKQLFGGMAMRLFRRA